MPKILVDFHHSSLLRSLNMLFSDRLGMEVYRPIGMEWFEQGYWAINNQRDTAEQFLGMSNLYRPPDGTPKLNDWKFGPEEQVFEIEDPGGRSTHLACSLDYFRRNQFDYVLCSVPQHIEIYKKLIRKYQPGAKLIVQAGNNWNLDMYKGLNLLASIAPQANRSNTMFYHQEFELDIFAPRPCLPTRKVFSFLNVIQDSGIGWEDYKQLKSIMEPKGYDFRSYGGQCPDGTLSGPEEIATMMAEAQFVFHVKPGGDGFGHVIHNAYAMGRPVITRSSHYRNQLAEQLLIPGTFIDLDRYGPGEIKNLITRLTYDAAGLLAMGKRASERFRQVVDYDNEAKEIKQWLNAL